MIRTWAKGTKVQKDTGGEGGGSRTRHSLRAHKNKPQNPRQERGSTERLSTPAKLNKANESAGLKGATSKSIRAASRPLGRLRTGSQARLLSATLTCMSHESHCVRNISPPQGTLRADAGPRVYLTRAPIGSEQPHPAFACHRSSRA